MVTTRLQYYDVRPGQKASPYALSTQLKEPHPAWNEAASTVAHATVAVAVVAAAAVAVNGVQLRPLGVVQCWCCAGLDIDEALLLLVSMQPIIGIRTFRIRSHSRKHTRGGQFRYVRSHLLGSPHTVTVYACFLLGGRWVRHAEVPFCGML